MTETITSDPWTINYQGKKWTHPRYASGKLMLLGDTVTYKRYGEFHRSKIVSFTVAVASTYPDGAAVLVEVADVQGTVFSPESLRQVKHNVPHCTDSCRGITRVRKTTCECGCHV